MSVRQRLIEAWGPGGEAAYAVAGCLFTMLIAGGAALLFREPLLFPSLGPSVFLFFETPTADAASVRNTLIGHLVGLLFGLGALALFGFWGAPSALQAGMTPARIVAAALAVAGTAGVLVILKAAHPPAGATTLIVALGLLTGTRALLFIPAGVLLVTAAAVALNRAVGEPQALWPRPKPSPPSR